MKTKRIRLIIIALMFVALNLIIFSNKQHPLFSHAFNQDIPLPLIVNAEGKEIAKIGLNSENNLAITLPLCNNENNNFQYALFSLDDNIEYVSEVQGTYLIIAARKQFNDTSISKRWQIKIERADCYI